MADSTGAAIGAVTTTLVVVGFLVRIYYCLKKQNENEIQNQAGYGDENEGYEGDKIQGYASLHAAQRRFHQKLLKDGGRYDPIRKKYYLKDGSLNSLVVPAGYGRATEIGK